MTLRKEGTWSSEAIDRIVARQASKIARAFVLAVKEIRDDATLAALEKLIVAGKFEEALEYLVKLGRAMSSASASAITDAATSAQNWLNTGAYLDAAVSFSTINVRAVNAFEANDLRLIRQFNDEQLAATRQAISRGIREGINPRDMARDFRQSIGLTRRQEAAVDNYRRMLSTLDPEALSRKLATATDLKTLRAAIAAEKPLTQAQIDKMVGRYNARYIAYRAEVIGRTEALRSAHQGTELMFQQLVDDGNVGKEELFRSWVTGADERVRDSHAFMNGQIRGIGEAFLSGKGNLLMYPGDTNAPGEETIQCRCSLTMRLSPGGRKALEAELAQKAALPILAKRLVNSRFLGR